MLNQKQDVQVHTNFSDGKATLDEMVQAAIALGIETIIISDHAMGWNANGKRYEFFPDIGTYTNYLQKINEVKEKYDKDIAILSGLEIEVDMNGVFLLDEGIKDYEYKNMETKKLGVQVVLGAIHSESFEEDIQRNGLGDDGKRERLIGNMIRVIQNKDIDIFVHPFQALHGQFSSNLTETESQLILQVFTSEWNNGHMIYLEINGKKYPTYEQWKYNKYEAGEMKTNDTRFLKEYKKLGGKFVVGSDAHFPNGFTNTDFTAAEDIGLIDSDIHFFV